MTINTPQTPRRANSSVMAKQRELSARQHQLKLVVNATEKNTTSPTAMKEGTDSVANRQATLRAHQEAENALCMALHYLRSNAGNIQGATRKAVQALAALNTLHAADAVHRQRISSIS